MWREPDSTSSVQDRSKPDQATRQALRRSSIRRQSSVRIPNAWRRTLGSPPPPPNPHHRDIPPVPRLSSSAAPFEAVPEPSRLPQSIIDANPPSPIPDPLPSEYRPRAGRSVTLEPPTGLDELPPLRRMNHRSIADSPPPVDTADALSTAVAHYRDTASRRSMSPSADHWETLLTTITPDPSLPSAESSFASAAASFPRAPRRSSPQLRRERLRIRRDRDAAQPSVALNRSPTPMDSPSSSDSLDALLLYHQARSDLARDNNVSNDRGNDDGDDTFCPNEPIESQTAGGAVTASEARIRAIFDREHAQTYRRLLDHAHSFHHSYERFDYFLAEFINAHSRRERTQSEAEDVLRAVSESTHNLLEAYDRQQRLGHERTSPDTRQRGSQDWEALFHRVLSSASQAGVSGAAMSGNPSLASLDDSALDARLHAAAMSENDSDLNELRALVRERTARGARRNHVSSR